MLWLGMYNMSKHSKKKGWWVTNNNIQYKIKTYFKNICSWWKQLQNEINVGKYYENLYWREKLMVRGIYRQFPKCSKCSLNQVIPIHNMNTIPVLEELHCLFQNSSTPDLFWIKAMNDAYLWYFRITWIKAICRIKGRISLFSLFLKKNLSGIF